MKSFKTYKLDEKRSHPDLNPHVSPYEWLEKYKNDSTVYISFTTINKIGINPSSHWKTTPNGIYTYPLKQVWKFFDHSRKIVKSKGTELYGDDRRYIQVMRGKQANFIEDLSTTYSKSDLQRDFKKLSRLYSNDFNMDEIKKEARRISKVSSSGATFWEMVKYLASYDSVGSSFTFKFSSLLRKLGYSGAADKSGKGIIHYNEKIQAVFFSRKAFTHVKTLDRNAGEDEDEHQMRPSSMKVKIINNLAVYLDESKQGDYGPLLSINSNGSVKLKFENKYVGLDFSDHSHDKVNMKVFPDEKMLKSVMIADLQDYVDEFYSMDILFDNLIIHEWVFAQILKNFDKMDKNFVWKFSQHLSDDEKWFKKSIKKLNPVFNKFFIKYLKQSKKFNQYKNKGSWKEFD